MGCELCPDKENGGLKPAIAPGLGLGVEPKNGFYEKMDQRYRKFEDSIKFDVNDQVQYDFENFVDYCWNSK